MKKTCLFIFLILGFGSQSCNKYMDIVPDNIAELDQAFSMRVTAERFLATCYNSLPNFFQRNANPAFLSGDEMWLNSTTNFSQGSWQNWYIALGAQNVNSPLLNYWDGNSGGKDLWGGIRECNIFLENIHSVPDMDEVEKDRWAAEVEFLKAYYHYQIMRMYGPIPIVDVNTPVFAEPEEVNFIRQPIDEVFAYIVSTIDGAIPRLMPDVTVPAEENGRITQMVAKAMKAEILMTAASPLFNGNTDYTSYLSIDGEPLFNATFSAEKWQAAADACLEAIEIAESFGKSLYRWTPLPNMTVVPQASTVNQMSLRQAVTERQNNSEMIWVNNSSSFGEPQAIAFAPRSFDPARISNQRLGGFMAPTINIVSMFYSKNGVPIEEDRTYDYNGRFELRQVPDGASEYQYNLIPGYNTIGFHFDREDRFYASLSFDGGRYFMSSHTSDAEAFPTNSRPGGNTAATNSPTSYSGTGYTVKKLVNYQSAIGTNNNWINYQYGFPIMRLANLYLLYAEAMNEVFGPNEASLMYLDRIRERSGLRGVIESWSEYSSCPGKPTTKEGLREIIVQERAIELAFEGQRYWDLRRWKTATIELNTAILGWDILQDAPETYYRPVTIFDRTFLLRDYFWPISLNELRRNPRLLQGPYW